MPDRTVFKYPLDLTGTNPENFVVAEKHVIGSQRGRIFMSESGPFFGAKTVVRDGTTSKVLFPVTDFLFVHAYREAMEATGEAVYCGVRIINPNVSTNIEIDVHDVGGEFSYSTFAFFDMLKGLLNDDRSV